MGKCESIEVSESYLRPFTFSLVALLVVNLVTEDLTTAII